VKGNELLSQSGLPRFSPESVFAHLQSLGRPILHMEGTRVCMEPWSSLCPTNIMHWSVYFSSDISITLCKKGNIITMRCMIAPCM
jgi:hypothetical protein